MLTKNTHWVRVLAGTWGTTASRLARALQARDCDHPRERRGRRTRLAVDNDRVLALRRCEECRTWLVVAHHEREGSDEDDEAQKTLPETTQAVV